MPILDIAADLSGSDSLVGSLGFDPLSLSGNAQGNATVTGEITEGIVFSDGGVALGIAYVTGDGGSTDGLPSEISIAAVLEGSDSLIGDGTVSTPDDDDDDGGGDDDDDDDGGNTGGEPIPSACDVTYDIEICHIDFING